ncbi:MAG: hypothetical protein FWC55_02695 [Firmicutes bacterium]|nr:hypothetical protein [Bacillota bacterium]
MEREHYRRVAESKPAEYTPGARRNRYATPPKKAGRGEKILAQCVVCGIALALLLIMSLINTPFTKSVRTNLRAAIGGQTSVEQVKSAYATVQGKLQSAFGKTPASNAPAKNAPASGGGAASPAAVSGGKPPAASPAAVSGAASPASNAGPASPAPSRGSGAVSSAAPADSGGADFRIDEDILRDLNAS